MIATRKPYPCGWCNAPVWRYPSQSRHAKSRKVFCGLQHLAYWRSTQRRRKGDGAEVVQMQLFLTADQRARIVAHASAARVPLSEYIVGKVLP